MAGFTSPAERNIIVFPNGKNIYPEELKNGLPLYTEFRSGRLCRTSYQGNNQTLVAEIFRMQTNGNAAIEEFKSYFEAEIKKVNQKMVAYKAIGQIKIREEDFDKNTSRKIKRYAIDKTID